MPTDTATAAVEQSRLLEAAGHVDEAQALIRNALADAPHHAGLLTRLAELLYRQGRLREAATTAGTAIEANPQLVQPYIVLAYAFSSGKQHTAALTMAREAVALDPDSAAAHCCLATCLAGESHSGKNLTEMRAAIARSIELNPENTALYITGARNLQLMHAPPSEVRTLVDAGLAMEPTDTDLQALRALDASFTGDKVRALGDILADDPTHRGARLGLAGVVWGSVARLASGVWIYALVVLLAEALLPWNLTDHVFGLFMAPLIGHWFGVFRRLRRQLPHGYLRRRLRRRPELVAGLAFAALAAVVANLAPLIAGIAFDESGVRFGYGMLLAACVIAGVAHLFVTVGRSRRASGDDEADPEKATSEVFGASVIWLIFTAAPVLLGFALYPVAGQPGALWFAVLVPVVLLATMCVEYLVIALLLARTDAFWKSVSTVFGIVVLAVLALLARQAVHEIEVTNFHHQSVDFTVPDFPPMPTFDFTIPTTPTP